MSYSKKIDIKSVQKEKLIQCYKTMVLCRKFEEAMGKLYRQGLIAGFCHLYIGQEAIIAGTEMALDSNDSTITSYRCHAHMLVASKNPVGIVAELLGRKGGVSKGKGGSMHMFDVKNKFFGGHGIVGAQVPIGTGIALAQMYSNEGGVCATFLGDGALNQGQVYESFNMAKIWNLPVIYIIENNQYAMGTNINRGCSNATALFERGLGFGIQGHKVDGMDALSVYNAMMEAKTFALEKGPVILEMDSYRYRGHSMSDPAKYRSKDELDHMKENRDPIEQMKTRLVLENIITEQEIANIDEEISVEVENSVEVASKMPYPDLSDLFMDVYCN